MTSGWSEPSPILEMQTSLRLPELTLSTCELARIFAIETVSVTVRRSDFFEVYPDLATRIRGALGRMLFQMGPPPKLWRNSPERPRAWEVLMEPLDLNIAKPMTVHVDVIADVITVHVHLIGYATYWRHDVMAGLVAAFDNGIKLSNTASSYTPMEIVEARHTARGGFEPFIGGSNEARLMFESPLRLRAENATLISAPSFLISIANRVKSLAPWFSVAMEEDWDSLHAAAWAIEAESNAMLPYRWERGSRRANARIPVLGFLGPLILRGPLERFVPYLHICEIMNAGSHAALGLGRYRMALLP